MKADIDFSDQTTRLEPALRFLSDHDGIQVAKVAAKFKVNAEDLWAWLRQFNRGKPLLSGHIIDGVKAGQQKLAPKVRSDIGRVRTAAARVIGKDSARNKPIPAAVQSVTAIEKPGEDLAAWLRKQGVPFKPVTSYEVEVTPELAANWLRLNVGNRTPSKTKIRKFSAAFAAGRWALNGESLKFSSTGRLLDGQSRLSALAAANVSARLELRGGLPDVTQESMDTGEARAHKHQLEMLGENNPNEVAAALRLVFFWEKGVVAPGGACSRLSDQMTNTAIRETLEKHPGTRESVGRCLSMKKLMAVSAAAFFHYVFSTVDKPEADAFFSRLASGANLDDTSPIYQLRERLTDDRLAQKKMQKREKFALIIKSWNAWYTSKPCPMLRFNSTETFPEIEGAKSGGAS